MKDILKRFSKSIDNERKELVATRGTLGGILIIAAVVAALVPSSTINDLGFLSMGLRGSVVLVPMSCALWAKGPFRSGWILAAIVLSPASVLVGKLLALPFDSLYLGMLVSVLCCAMGRLWGQKNPTAARRSL